MNKGNHISLIIFDMDGLMFDTEKLAIPTWKKAGEEYGFSIEPAHIAKTIGINAKDTQKVFENYFGKDFPFIKDINSLSKDTKKLVFKEFNSLFEVKEFLKT